MNQPAFSRRHLVAAGAAALLAPRMAALAAEVAVRPADADPWKGLNVGVATYTLRKLTLDDAIKAITRVGLSYCSLKDFHLSLKSTADQRKAAVEKLKAANITPLSCGVITLKNDEAMVKQAFDYAKDLGASTIVCNPAPDALPLCEKFIKQYDIKLAIHNHGPEDKIWPTPYEPLTAVESLDPRFGICIDVGHTARAGVDPAQAVEKCGPRLYDIHLKDLARVDRRGAEVECGRGLLDLRGIINALLKVKFAGHVGFEHEKNPDDVLPGLAECVGYLRGIMA